MVNPANDPNISANDVVRFHRKFSMRGRVRSVLVSAAAGASLVGSVAGPALSKSQDLLTLNSCGPSGSATNAMERKLNPKKNRYIIPSAENFDASITLQSLLKRQCNPHPSELDPEVQSDEAAEIEGYITEVKEGGAESCNCGSDDPQFTDTHMFIGARPNDSHNLCIIAEVTPRMRRLMADEGIDWSTAALKRDYTGKLVRISGYLFDDEEHHVSSAADRPTGTNIWRASCWEIHPVTEIALSSQKGAPMQPFTVTQNR